MINAKDRLIVAIDTDEFDKAKELIDQLEDSVDIFKVGLEQYVATKGKTVDYLKEKGKKIFLDLKFHDIPNTMKSAVKAAVRDNVWLMTIHVSDLEGMRQCALVAKEEAERLNIEKPIIISEGKTDWKHFKAALSHFKENNEFEDLDLEIVEYDFEFGDPKLNGLLTQYSIFPHKYKVIGIFDCDEANGKRIHKSGGKMNYGNNIWGMSIPVPKFREYNTNGISIEFLYSDEDLKCSDENGRRIFITSEFNEDGRLKSNLHIGVKNNHDVKNYIMPEKEKIQANEVIDIQGKSLALSKEQFATNILEKVGKFSEVNFDAFKPVFERLREILQNK